MMCEIPPSSGNFKNLLPGFGVFFLLGVVLGHCFGLFPSVPIATPKIPGAAIIEGPLTARKKK